MILFASVVHFKCNISVQKTCPIQSIFRKHWWHWWPGQTSGNSPVLGPRLVKIVEDRWKHLLWPSSCPVKKIAVGSPSYEKRQIRSCKTFEAPVKLGFSMWLLVLRSGKGFHDVCLVFLARHYDGISLFQLTSNLLPYLTAWILNDTQSHNVRDGISNHQPHHCLLNPLFRRRSKKTLKLRVTGLCAGNSQVTNEFPRKWPATWKMFPIDDVIMSVLSLFTNKRWIELVKFRCIHTYLKFIKLHQNTSHWKAKQPL